MSHSINDREKTEEEKLLFWNPARVRVVCVAPPISDPLRYSASLWYESTCVIPWCYRGNLWAWQTRTCMAPARVAESYSTLLSLLYHQQQRVSCTVHAGAIQTNDNIGFIYGFSHGSHETYCTDSKVVLFRLFSRQLPYLTIPCQMYFKI